jgi:hypothetical protein
VQPVYPAASVRDFLSGALTGCEFSWLSLCNHSSRLDK